MAARVPTDRAETMRVAIRGGAVTVLQMPGARDRSARVPGKPKTALLKRIRLVVLDIDGTMTDGRLYYGAEGEAMKAFDVRDGHGLRLLQMYGGVKLAVLT